LKVRSLELVSFRNFKTLSLDLSPPLHVFSGLNAQGKSNLLEALTLLSGRKPFRAAKDEEMILFGENEGSVKAAVEHRGGESQIQIFLSKNARKKALLNGKTVSRANPLTGIMALVLFTPEDVLTPSGPSGARRALLDNFLCQVSADYREAWDRYQELLTQRQRLLGQIAGEGASADLLDPWDKLLAEAGSRVVLERAGAAPGIAERARRFYAGIAGEEEKAGGELVLKYERSWERSTERNVAGDGSREFFERRLRQERAEEIRRGRTLTGPHRDDFSFWLGEKPLKRFGSRGQHRSAILSVKLAEWEALRERWQEGPLLMLDDVFSELDERRRQALLGLLRSGGQVFLTTAEAGAIELPGTEKGSPAFWRLEEGRLERLTNRNARP